jgi:hypothetical protein
MVGIVIAALVFIEIVSVIVAIACGLRRALLLLLLRTDSAESTATCDARLRVRGGASPTRIPSGICSGH